MIEELIGQHYPWALDMFQGYNMEVKKADVGRVFILHHYGGLYLDLDCRCFRDVTDSLTDYDFVIQGCVQQPWSQWGVRWAHTACPASMQSPPLPPGAADMRSGISLGVEETGAR